MAPRNRYDKVEDPQGRRVRSPARDVRRLHRCRRNSSRGAGVLNRCMSCLRALKTDKLRYHPRCLRALFDSSMLPSLDVELAKLHTLALAMVGHTSLSGVQRKISLGFVPDRTTLTVAVERG